MKKIKAVYGIVGVIEIEFETEVTEQNTIERIKESGFKEVLEHLEEDGGLIRLLPDEDFSDCVDFTEEARKRFSFHYEEI